MTIQRRTRGGKTRYIARYRDPSGKERSKTFDLQREAKAWLAEQQRAMRRGEWVDTTTSPTVGALIAEREARAARPGTAQQFSWLSRQLGPLHDMPVHAVRPSHIRTWIDSLGAPTRPGGPLAPSTLHVAATTLRGVFSRAIEDDLILRHPMRGISLPRPARRVERADIPTIEAIEAAMQLCRHPEPGRHAKPQLARIIQVAAETGLRGGELCGLRVRSVDFLRAQLHVVEQVSQVTRDYGPLKTESSRRTVPLAESTLAVLDEQLRECPRGRDESVFCTRAGRPMTSSEIGAQLKAVVERTGMPFTLHALRHLYASRLLESGVSVKRVQRLLGHATATITLDTYAHVIDEATEQVRGIASIVRDQCGTGNFDGAAK